MLSTLPPGFRDLLASFGYAMYSWGHLEHSVDSAILMLKRKFGTTERTSWPFERKIASLRRIVELSDIDDDLKSDGYILIDQIVELSKIRNALIHGVVTNDVLSNTIGPITFMKFTKNIDGVDYKKFEGSKEIMDFGTDTIVCKINFMLWLCNFNADLRNGMGDILVKTLEKMDAEQFSPCSRDDVIRALRLEFGRV